MINMASLAALVIIVVCACVAWLVVDSLNKVWPAHWRWLKVLAAGLLPTLIIVAVLVAWHVYARIEYERGPREGFMSPLLILLYGYPYVLLNIVVSFAVAFRGSRQR